METTKPTSPVPNWNVIAQQINQPFQPDVYHQLAPGGKIEPIAIRYKQLDAVPSGTEVWWDVYDALCMFSAYASPRDRETLALSMARSVEQLAWNEDQFQKGMVAIFEELDKWGNKWPSKDGEELEPDDVHGYLYRVAHNAMRGRKRKPVEVDQAAVKDAVSWEEDEVADNESLQTIEAECKDDIDRQILRFKRDRLSEKEIGEKLGLSRDQVHRRITRIYENSCKKAELEPTPMGRKARKPAAP